MVALINIDSIPLPVYHLNSQISINCMFLAPPLEDGLYFYLSAHPMSQILLIVTATSSLPEQDWKKQ